MFLRIIFFDCTSHIALHGHSRIFMLNAWRRLSLPSSKLHLDKNNKHHSGFNETLKFSSTAKSAVLIGLRICDNVEKKIKKVRYRAKLEKTSENVRNNNLSTSSYSENNTNVEHEVSDGKLSDCLTDISGVREPHPSNEVVLRYPETNLAALRRFAADRGIPLKRKKPDMFKAIREAYKKNEKTSFLLQSDLKKSGFELSTAYMKATVRTKRHITCETATKPAEIPVSFFSTLSWREHYPISHFIYVNNKSIAENVCLFLTNPGLGWELWMSAADVLRFQLIVPAINGGNNIYGNAKQSTTDNNVDSRTNLKGTAPESLCTYKEKVLRTARWSRLCPKLPTVRAMTGPDIPDQHPTSSSCNIIGVDIETTGLDPHTSKLRLISLSLPQYPTLIFDVFQLWGTNECPVTKRLKQLILFILENPKITKVYYNGKFDLKFLQAQFNLTVVQPIRDLMLESSLLLSGTDERKVQFRLNDIVTRFLHVTLPVEEAIPWHIPDAWNNEVLTSDQLVYASRDAAVLPYLAFELSLILADSRLTFTATLENECMPVVGAIELRGINLDKSEWKIVAEINKNNLHEAEKTLRKELGWIGDDYTQKNVGSPSQVLSALRQLKIEVLQEQETNMDGTELIKATNARTLGLVVGAPPVVAALTQFRQLKKLQSGFVDVLPKYINSSTDLRQLGAVSGRFACRRPNLQQVPRNLEYRKCFRASNGKKLIIVDFSQIELRVAADFANDITMIDAFSAEIDLHSLTASLVKDVPFSDVTKTDRQLAKALNFGLVYGISARGLKNYAALSYGVFLSYEEAVMFRDKFFHSYKGLKNWHTQVYASFREGYMKVDGLETRTRGDRRVLFSDLHKPTFQKLLNYPVQGTSADITKQSLVDLHPKLRLLNAHIVNVVHDEIVVEAPKHFADETLEIVKKTMEAAGNKFLKRVQCRADGKVGDNWSDKV